MEPRKRFYALTGCGSVTTSGIQCVWPSMDTRLAPMRRERPQTVHPDPASHVIHGGTSGGSTPRSKGTNSGSTAGWWEQQSRLQFEEAVLYEEAMNLQRQRDQVKGGLAKLASTAETASQAESRTEEARLRAIQDQIYVVVEVSAAQVAKGQLEHQRHIFSETASKLRSKIRVGAVRVRTARERPVIEEATVEQRVANPEQVAPYRIQLSEASLEAAHHT